MFLSKRSNGIYYLWYVDEYDVKHKISTRTTRRSAALSFVQRFRQDETTRTARLKRATLSQFMDDFIEYSRGVHRPNTSDTYQTALREFIRYVGDVPINTIGIREIERFLRKKKTEASEWSARKYYISLASAFETARRWGCVRTNPFRSVEKPKTREISPAFLTKKDFRKLIEVVDDSNLRDLFICAVSTGLRLAELAALEWSDVDMDGRVIHVRNSGNFTTKSKKNRAVPMSDHLQSVLAKGKGEASNALMFHLNGRQMTRWYVAKKFKQAVIRAGLCDRLHFHSLRHTFASWLVQDGVSLYAVQKLLGHSSIGVTQVYSHLQPEQLHETVNRLKISVN